METTGLIPPPGNASHSRGLSAAGPSGTEPIAPFSLIPLPDELLPHHDQLRSVIASPAMMARATGEGPEPSSANPSRTWTAGCAIIRGVLPRCRCRVESTPDGQVAVTDEALHVKAHRPIVCRRQL